MAKKLIYFSQNGLVVHHPNPAADNWTEPYGTELGERRPVIFKPGTRQIYVGEPGWYHGDTYHHFGVDQWDYNDRAHEGYFNGDRIWGGGPLKWYNPPDDATHQAVNEALLNSGMDVPQPNDNIEQPDDEDDWSDELDDGSDWIPNEGQ